MAMLSGFTATQFDTTVLVFILAPLTGEAFAYIVRVFFDAQDVHRAARRARTMIFVSQENLGEVEYLLRQSAQGNHILFDPELIKASLRAPIKKSVYKNAEPLLEQMMGLKGLKAKYHYIEHLPPSTRLALCQLYFNVVDHFLTSDESQADKRVLQ